MVTTSYPRFRGDAVGTFLDPIARGVAARGHEVHVVLPWHPLWQRGTKEDGVVFHPFRYAPMRRLHVFGYAAALKADTVLRPAAYAAAPLALVAGSLKIRAVVRRHRPNLVHAHWVIPGGAMAALAVRSVPLVISLHGSDVYVAERHLAARRAAHAAFRRARWVTACSDDLQERAVALGADAGRIETIPYGVDASRFSPDPSARAEVRQALGLGADDPLLFAAGRLVRKKGFEYLIDAAALVAPKWPSLRVVIAGSGDLHRELSSRVALRGVERHVRLLGAIPQDRMPQFLAAADLVVVPSIRDDAGNVDGLPNVVLEALASGTALVTTRAGGIGSVAVDGHTAAIVPERDASAMADAIDRLLGDAGARGRLGRAARTDAMTLRTWERVAAEFERVYALALDETRESGLPSK